MSLQICDKGHYRVAYDDFETTFCPMCLLRKEKMSLQSKLKAVHDELRCEMEESAELAAKLEAMKAKPDSLGGAG